MTRKTITDHAVLRYLERVAGLNTESVRAAIEERTRVAVAAGASSITVDGFRYRIVEGRVVTVIPARGRSRTIGGAFEAWTTAKEPENR
jgi:hypothetical protein